MFVVLEEVEEFGKIVYPFFDGNVQESDQRTNRHSLAEDGEVDDGDRRGNKHPLLGDDLRNKTERIFFAV